MKTKEKLLIINVMILTFIINFSTKVSARAGRSSHHSSSHRSSSHGSSSSYSSSRRMTGYHRRGYGSSGPFSFIGFTTIIVILISIILIVYFIMRVKKPSYNHLKSKKDTVGEKLSLLKMNDFAWDIDSINTNFQEAFMSIQNAWSERNMDLARDYMSKRLCSSYELKIKNMKRKHEINVIKDINIIEAFPVKASEKSVISPNKKLSILVNASLIDYYADDRTLKVKSGSTKRTSFTEVWNFIYVNNRWILNSINQTK